MNLLTGRSDFGQRYHGLERTYLRLEGLILLISAPLLLAPDAFPVLTATSLTVLGIVWVLSIFIHPLTPTPFNLTFLLFGITLIVGILVSADQTETLPKTTSLILGLAVWRFVVMVSQNRRTVSAFLAVMLLVCIAFSTVGFLSLQELPKVSFFADINSMRAALLPAIGGLSVHPNQLSGLICLFLPLLFSLLASPPIAFSSRPMRVVVFLATIWSLALLALTQSRGGWIGFAAGLYVLLAMGSFVIPASNRRRALRWMLVAITLCGAITLIWVDPVNVVRLWIDPPESTLVGTLRTLNFRKDLWPWALTAISDFPFTGVGLGAFRQVAFRLYPLNLSPAYDIAHAHNIFLQTALDLGLPGLVIYLAILFIAFVTGWHVARRDAKFRSISLGILAGLTSLHIYGLADALALGSKPGIIFWFSLGLLTAMNKLAGPTDQPGN